MIGEGGASLSGGEKQRLSIARAMLKNAPIVIFDEATANVDPENEDRLQTAIEELTKDKTIIMIAHRLKTVRNADQILVVSGGHIVQQGKHDDLIKQKGIYADFINGRKQVVLLCGESGCGKTTLTRLINGLAPEYYNGQLSGQVLINGKKTATTPLHELSKIVGSVFQNPRSQFFTVDTTGEIAFGCENIGLPKEEIYQRIGQVSGELKIQKLLDRSLFALSGGEKQKIWLCRTSTINFLQRVWRTKSC